MGRWGVVLGLVAWSAWAQAPARFDVLAARELLASSAELPSVAQRAGAWTVERPGAKRVVVDLKKDWLSWTEDTTVRWVTNELTLLPTAGDDVIALYSRVDAPQDGQRAPTVTLRAWRVTPATRAFTETTEPFAELPPLADFVAKADAAKVAELPEADVTPWVVRVVELPHGGATAHVHYSAFALEMDCDKGKRRAAPALLCRNVAALKYGARQGTWDRATASFHFREKGKPKR